MRPLHYRFFWLALGVVLLALVLYFTLSAPAFERDLPGGDKLAHGVGFFVLMFWYAALFQRRYYLWLGLFLLAVGGMIELAQGWMALGHALGWVNSHIILGLVFIVVLQPIAYVMRLTGHDPLRRRRKEEKTYRENRQDHRTDLTRIF